MDSRVKLIDISNMLGKLGLDLKPNRANEFIALLPDDSSALTYEPALAAAAVLSYYWEGMNYPDGGLDSLRMFMDVQRISDLLYAWTHKVVKKLDAELSSAKKE